MPKSKKWQKLEEMSGAPAGVEKNTKVAAEIHQHENDRLFNNAGLFRELSMAIVTKLRTNFCEPNSKGMADQ